MKQLHDQKSITPVNIIKLSDIERNEIIDSLMLIEEEKRQFSKGSCCGSRRLGKEVYVKRGSLQSYR